MGNDDYLSVAKEVVLRMEQSLAQADAASEWGEVARSVTRGLERFVDLMATHRGLTPGGRAALLRWLQVRYLRVVAAMNPSVERALREFLTSGRRTMDQALPAACALQIKLHVRTWCEEVLRDPATVADGGPKDVGHVGRVLDEVADLCRDRLDQWDRDGIEPATLSADQFQVLGQDFSLAEE